MTKILLVGWVGGCIAFMSVGAGIARADDEDLRSHPEHGRSVDSNYYIGGSLGYTNVNYHANSTLQGFSDSQTAGTSTQLPYTLDLVFLIPLPDRTTGVGFGFNGIIDAYFPKDSYNYADIHQDNFVLTARHYFGQSVGHGLFIRGDLGWCIVGSTTDAYNPNVANPSTSGFTWLAGGGYGFSLSPHVTLNLEGDYGVVKLSSGALGDFQVKAGVLVGL
jgi:hypothetical protein